MDRNIVVVTEGGPHIQALVNAMADRFGPTTVIEETPESKKALLLGRARRQGWIAALGQLGTMILVRLGKRFFGPRAERIERETGLETRPRTGQTIIKVPSANSPDFVAAVERLRPDVILLAGCRLLSKRTLAAIPCPVLNYHAGITPKYRGMNGGYWALATGDAGNFGTTVHLVDAGVDTGGVLHQVRGKPEPGDNIALYPLRLAAMSRDICIRSVEDALDGRLSPVSPDMPSRQWYHPTIWFYLWTGVTKGVW
ncbi:MAG: formyl transferase [Mesorhizobium sp.]|nr:formyl transferase [Mesorhizobium sp.]MBL8576038.1 formyl transferase [Mesorhizobium sp.]